MDGHQLPLQMRRQLRHRKSVRLRLNIVAVGLRLGGLLNIDDAPVPGRNLHALISEALHPFGDVRKIVIWRLIGKKLSEEDCGTFYLWHRGKIIVYQSARKGGHRVLLACVRSHASRTEAPSGGHSARSTSAAQHR